MQRLVFDRLINLVWLVAAILVTGTCGYTLLEGWPLLDGLYMTIITLSTVGYGETQELSQTGRVFTAILILVSMIVMACWTAGVTSVFVSGELSGVFSRKRELKMIAQMSNHTIVCGGGLMARTVVDQLVREDKSVVAIIEDPEEIQLMRRLQPLLPIVEGDPQSELALADANVLNARFLVAALEDDMDNLLITITGKGLGTDIQVLTCAQNNELASRMFKVGADQVICPLVIGGEHVARMIA